MLYDFGQYTILITFCCRHVFPGDMFGVNPADEVEGLLFIYCKFQADQKPGESQSIYALDTNDLFEMHF